MNQEPYEWKLEYLCDSKGESFIETWLGSLTKDQFKSVAKELKLLALCGNALQLPHSRSLKNGLFELRERKYGFRIYYTFLNNKIIFMLHAGDKKTQTKDINIAREYIKKLDYYKEELFNESKKFSTVS